VRQCQRATAADFGLRQAYLQVRQIEALRSQAPGQAHFRLGPSCDSDVGLQALECAIKTFRTPLPSRLHQKLLHLQGAQWPVWSWQLASQGRHTQRRLLDTRQQAVTPASLGRIRARSQHPNSRL
jgi:hypothetical protein